MADDDTMELDDQDGRSTASSPRQLDVHEEVLNEKYPNRPRNHSQTLPFHSLFQDLFNPLEENRQRKSGPRLTRRQLGPRNVSNQSPHEIRRAIIERYISRWRKEVGDDVYPALRLILPDKDRERAMYGMKEKALAKFFVKIMKIDKNSEDGYNMLNWKLPGRSESTRRAGDFPGRAYEVLVKRPFRTEVGDMTIGDVNSLLDKLSAAGNEETQLPIFEEFYRSMNPEELKWLISIILRGSLHVGATEKTFLTIWHPDAEALFNVSSSLRRVCWELHNPEARLENEDRGVNLMQCFQPQLAQFQTHKLEVLINKMSMTEEDNEFWIEEKLDGERMQMHMETDENVVGGKKFKFWSRKAKDYTYLYGESLHDPNSALTRHLKDAFCDGVENLILDGEMITWDPETDKAVPFGTLKTAALAEQRNQYAGGQRPMFRIFDILFLNGQRLTRYTLRDRRKALEASISSVHRRFEVHEYRAGKKADEIETRLRQVVAEASEGLVVKNPRSAYHLNDRNDDWIKVKPEYMEEFGESLDCLIIGGYYGSGHRGGALASFLCGVRSNDNEDGGPSKRFLSFCKVGGGMTANDYANIRHQTEGKWNQWDIKNPPTDFIELAGGMQQRERPDMWIEPQNSLVVQIKAASVSKTDEFATALTLRFPRFQRLRSDKDWGTALSLREFYEVKDRAETEKHENQEKKRQGMNVDTRRKRQRTQNSKKPLTVAGYSTVADNRDAEFDIEKGDVFKGLTVFILTEGTRPKKTSKAELEQLVKAHGGQIVQAADTSEGTICIAERRTVKVASIIKRAKNAVLKPIWLFDCIDTARADFTRGLVGYQPVPLKPELERHVFFAPDGHEVRRHSQVDKYGDSYARNTSVQELAALLSAMPSIVVANTRLEQDTRFETALGDLPGSLFAGLKIYVDSDRDGSGSRSGNASKYTNDGRLGLAMNAAAFGGASIVTDIEDQTITHVVVAVDKSPHLGHIRAVLSQRSKVPRIVSLAWIEDSWKEKTRLDEERYAVC